MISPYYYRIKGNNWAVYKWDNEIHSSGTFVSLHATKEEARKEVYRLNGWKYKK